jgi:hypothetical protein
LEWTWVEDKTTLDGASTAELRKRFRKWTFEEVARQPGKNHSENKYIPGRYFGPGFYDPDSIPRFHYFIKVDEEVLQSCAGEEQYGAIWPSDAFVKFVDASWEPEYDEWGRSGNVWGEERWEDVVKEREVHEDVEGCTEENVGWMRMRPEMLDTYFYDAMNAIDDQWRLYYERPPAIVRW